MMFRDEEGFFCHEEPIDNVGTFKLRDLDRAEQVEWDKLDREVAVLQDEIRALGRKAYDEGTEVPGAPAGMKVARDFTEEEKRKLADLGMQVVFKSQDLDQWVCTKGIVGWSSDRPVTPENVSLLPAHVRKHLARVVLRLSVLSEDEAAFLPSAQSPSPPANR